MSGPRRQYGVMTDRWGWQPTAWQQNGLTSWSWRKVPAGLVTRRQMRAEGLAPGTAWPVGQLVFRRKRREVRALLYDRDDLVPKRVPSVAQLAALDRALAARRWCPTCEADVGYCIPTSLGCCVDCAFPDLAQQQIDSSADARTAREVRDAAA
jgi:hypothetical protein